MAAALRLLSAAALAASVRGQGLLGHPNCRCIDPWGLPEGGAPQGLTFVESSTGRGCLRGEAGNCYPIDYGSQRCSAWDINLPPRCADREGRPLTNAPLFCAQPWCFVDASCRLHQQRTTIFLGHELFYSYETCGSGDFFNLEVLVGTLRGKVLKAGVPASDGTSLVNNGPGMIPTGWSADFQKHILDEAGAETKITEISEESQRAFPLSTYSACVRDVGMGKLDFCFGSYWETPERLGMTEFTPIYQTDLYYLIVEGQDGASSSGTLTKVFKPFSFGLWVLFAMIFTAVGFFMWLFGEVGDYGIVKGTVMGVQYSALKFMGHGGGLDSAKSRSGNFLLLGFTFLSMLGLASYTANLSSFLLMANLHTGLKSLDAAIDNEIMICALQSTETMLREGIPKIEPVLYPVENWMPMLDAFKSKKCGAMLMHTEQFKRMRAAVPPFDRHGKLGMCNLRKVGEPVLALPNAAPISRDLDHAYGYLWAREKITGKIDGFKKNYPQPYTECPKQEGMVEGAKSMEPGDLLGGLLIGLGLLVASVVLYGMGWGRVNVNQRVDVDEEGNELPASSNENAEVIAAIKNLEDAMKSRGVPVGIRHPDNLRDFLEEAKTNPRRFVCTCCAFFSIFCVFSMLIIIVKTTDF